MSDIILTKTGASQSTVLSPFHCIQLTTVTLKIHVVYKSFRMILPLLV